MVERRIVALSSAVTARWRPITTPPQGARACVGSRGRRRRRSGRRSLGRTRPESTRRQRAHRTTPMGGWTLGMADSWGDGSSVRAASITEDDGKEVVDEDDSCVEIASVTFACRRARKLACRLRPEARPSGERPYTRLTARCFARRRDPAQGRAPRLQRSASAAEGLHLRATHAASKSSVHPKAALSRRGWTQGAFDGTVIHGERVVRRARHEGSGVKTRAFTYSNLRTLPRRCP
jgi:hypothetical protein